MRRATTAVSSAAIVMIAAVAGWAAATRQSAAIAGILLIAALIIPPWLLLAGGVLTSGGASQTVIVGPLIAADLLLMAWLVRSAVRGNAHLPDGALLPVFALALFLGWALLATYLNGQSVTPLLRIGLYSAVLMQLARAGTTPRLIYASVVVFAACNIIGGILEGETRLTGVFVGDPAQMGALIIAALVPLITGDLRFPGRWLVGVFLLFGIWLTGTRSVWFATIMVGAVWLTGRRETSRARTILVMLMVTIVGLKLVGVVTEALDLNADSAGYRIDSILNGIRNGLAHPIFGNGWAKVEFVDIMGRVYQGASTVVPYNLFVNLFTSVGIPGLVLFCIFLWSLLGQLVHRKDASLLFAVAFLSMSVTEMTVYAGSLLTVLFFVYSGLGLWGAGGGTELPSDRSGASGVSASDRREVGVNR